MTQPSWQFWVLDEMASMMFKGYAWCVKGMARHTPDGLSLGHNDVTAYMLARSFNLNGCVVVSAYDGEWCPCGKGDPHRMTKLAFGTYGLSDEQMKTHLSVIYAELDGSLHVDENHAPERRKRSRGNAAPAKRPQYDA